VAVAPITHTSGGLVPNVAVEIPLRVKEHLRLDSERSWVILEESRNSASCELKGRLRVPPEMNR